MDMSPIGEMLLGDSSALAAAIAATQQSVNEQEEFTVCGFSNFV